MGPKKGKKKKKTPEEIAEENRIREEEERKALEAELARQEEERKRLEEEERIRQEKLSQQRTVELDRLTGEEGECTTPSWSGTHDDCLDLKLTLRPLLLPQKTSSTFTSPRSHERWARSRQRSKRRRSGPSTPSAVGSLRRPQRRR